MVVKRGRGTAGPEHCSTCCCQDGWTDTSRALRPLPSSLLSALLQKDRACVINQSEAEFIPIQINGGLGSCVAPCSSCSLSWLSEAVESSGDAQSGSTWS